MYQNTALIQIEVKKTPTNFNTLFAMSLCGVRPFKGLNAQHIYMLFGVEGFG
jgi:hypothetical protein